MRFLRCLPCMTSGWDEGARTLLGKGNRLWAYTQQRGVQVKIALTPPASTSKWGPVYPHHARFHDRHLRCKCARKNIDMCVHTYVMIHTRNTHAPFEQVYESRICSKTQVTTSPPPFSRLLTLPPPPTPAKPHSTRAGHIRWTEEEEGY